MAPMALPANNVKERAIRPAPKQVPRRPGSRTTQVQRAIIKWMSHSRVGAAFALVNVTVMKGIPLFSFLLVLRRAWRLSVAMRRIRLPFTYAVARTLAEGWASLEFLFFLWFRWKKKSLESKRAYQPSVLWKSPGERKRLLLKVLGNIERIYAGNQEERARPESLQEDHVPILKNITRSSSMRLDSSPRKRHGLQVKGIQPHGSMGLLIRSTGDHAVHAQSPEVKAVRRLISAPSVENFLRFQDEPEAFGLEVARHAPEDAQPKPVLFSKVDRGSGSLPSAPSVENLLRCWDEEASLVSSSPHGVSGGTAGGGVSSQELLYMKHIELCTWYKRVLPRSEICSDIREIKRGNIEDWVLSYWFDGAESIDALSPKEQDELPELVDEVARWACLPQEQTGEVYSTSSWEGRNDNLRCFRLRSDPFPALHRPLLAYCCTALLGPAFGSRSLVGLGFRVYRAGSTEYWFRPPSPSADWLASSGPRRPCAQTQSRPPLVFCHGIGVGPTMCLSFVDRLNNELGKDYPIFLVDTAAVSMRFAEDIPGAREVAANMVDMLQVWGFSSGHFVGHSFGSFLLAWMLRYQRSYVERCTFIDPVCFLLLKVLVEGHELQQVRNETRMDTMEMAIKYFVLTELFVCNFVCRCFFWEESQLDMQDLEGLEAMLVLEAEDAIVPTHSVYRLVVAERARRRSEAAGSKARASSIAGLEVVWVEGQPHAGFLVDGEVAQDVCRRLGHFHRASSSTE